MTDIATSKPIIIKRGPYKGTVEATPGLRVSVPVAGDREFRNCFVTWQPGTIEAIEPGEHVVMRGIRVRLDTPSKWHGAHVTVYATDRDGITALD
jgi:hypothetical protein